MNRQMYMRALTAAVLVGSLSLAACSKDTDNGDGWNGKGLRLNAEKGHSYGNSKTLVDGLKVYWADGDQVYLGNGTESESRSAVVRESGGAAVLNTSLRGTIMALFPAAAYSDINYQGDVTLTLPGSYTFSKEEDKQKIDFPMVGVVEYEENAEGANLDMKHVCAGINLQITNSTVGDLILDRVTITSSNSQICGERTLSTATLPSSLTVDPVGADNDAQKTVVVTFTDVTVAKGEQESVQIPVYPMAAEDELVVTVEAHNAALPGVGATSENLKVTYTNTGRTTSTFERNTVMTAPVTMSIAKSQVTANAVFSVSSTKKVYFSNGNLQYNTTGETWSFISDLGKYEVEGGRIVNSTPASNKDGAFFCFCYGTSGYNGKAPTTLKDDYTSVIGNLYDGSGTPNNYDWGWYNEIEGVSRGWRTLSFDEWDYLLSNASGRETTGFTVGAKDNVRSVYCTVKGLKGLLLIPDNFTDPTSIEWGENSADMLRSNSSVLAPVYQEIPEAEWNALQAAGCVFLPELGWTGDDKGDAAYWTATQNSGTQAKLLYFNSQGVSVPSVREGGTIWNKNKKNYVAVRLVRDAQ